MNKACNKNQFTIYMLVAFVLAYISEGISCMFANKGNAAMFAVLNMFTMFIPMIAVLIANRRLAGFGWKPVFKGKIKYYLMAWFLPVLFMILGAVLFFVAFPKTFDMSGAYMKQSLISNLGDAGEAAYEQMVNSGITPMVYVMVALVQVVTYAPVVNGVFALGEEIGWRGYMYPYLKDKFGTLKGRIIGGLIWGTWHWPIIIFAGYEYGKEYFGAPFAGPVLFLLITTVFGIFLDYLYEKTDCILVPSIAHGAINAAAGLPVFLMNPDFSKYSIFGPVNVGLISIIPMLVFAVAVSIRRK